MQYRSLRDLYTQQVREERLKRRTVELSVAWAGKIRAAYYARRLQAANGSSAADLAKV